MLLPTKSKSKAFAFCRNGQDLVAHGILLQIKLLRQIIFELDIAKQSCNMIEKIDKKLNNTKLERLDDEDFAEIHSKAKWCLNIIEQKSICNSSQIKATLNIILQKSLEKQINNSDIKDWLNKIQQTHQIHPALTLGLENLKETLNLLDLNNRYKSSKMTTRLQDKFCENVKNEVKIRFLIVQTVIKKFKKIEEDIPCVQKINEVIDCLKILDIETFQVSLSTLFFMGEEFTDLDMSLLRENLSMFYCYLSVWSSMFYFAWNLHEKYSTYLNR